MAFTILNPNLIEDSGTPGTFTSWTIGANGAFIPAVIAPDNHGADASYFVPGTGTDNQLYQTGVFPDYGTGVNHRITVVVNAVVGGGTLEVYFGATLAGTITTAGTHTFTAAATTSDVLALEMTAGFVQIDHVLAADLMFIGGPQSLMPAYNPSVWYLDSINKTKPGFRYFVQVLNAANTVVATYRYIPAITTGYAIIDLTRILKNFVSFDDNTTGVQKVPNSWFGYYIKAYEEFSVPFVYDDYDVVLDVNTALVAASATHNFSPGDLVNVAQTDGGALKPVLEGIHTVVAPTVAGTTDLYIDVPSATTGAGSTMGGQVIFADNRKTISAVQYTSSLHYVFNGAVPFIDFPFWNDSEHTVLFASSLTRFLTSMPRTGFYVYDTQDVRLNFANWFTENKVIYFENSNGDVFSMTTGTTMNTEAVIGANVGPGITPTVVSGTLPLVKSDTEWYDVWVTIATVQATEKIRFYIDRRCRINDYEILFMDRMGSMNSFAFELRDLLTNNNTKSTFKKLAGGLGIDDQGNPGYTYTSDAFGENSYNIEFDQTLKLNTNYMDNASSIYFQELVTSPVTLLKVATRTYISVIVSTASTPEYHQKDKRLIRYSIDVRPSSKNTINI